MEPIRLAIQNVAASAGAETVENAIRMVPGVISVRTEPSGHEVLVEAADNVGPDELIAAARKAGYIAVLAG